MATALQKQGYFLLSLSHSVTKAELAGYAAGLFLPGAGIAVAVIAETKMSHEERDLYDQRLRVGLCLMDDAGFDIREAPAAWWVLSLKPKQTFEDSFVPPISHRLYEILNAVWHDKLVAMTPESESGSNAAPHASGAHDRP